MPTISSQSLQPVLTPSHIPHAPDAEVAKPRRRLPAPPKAPKAASDSVVGVGAAATTTIRRASRSAWGGDAEATAAAPPSPTRSILASLVVDDGDAVNETDLAVDFLPPSVVRGHDV